MIKRWVFFPPNRPLQTEIASKLKISPLLAQVLVNRGVADIASARSFLQPQISSLGDPSLLPDIEKASIRVNQAIREGERIVIYGDYDVDGLSATALMYRCLKLLGAQVSYYIPERLEEGYGLNADAIQRLRKDGADVILTVDCGINACREADIARMCGIDLIITDHHRPGQEMPNALAVVNPKLQSPNHIFRDLSGVGIAFKLAWAIGQNFSSQKKVSPDFKDFLLSAMGLVALGTIADVVPLVGENRVVTKYGLHALQHTEIPGLRALLDVADLSRINLDAFHVGYRLGPRLNAPGRIGSAGIVVELLTTTCKNRATEIANFLEQENKRRQEIQVDILVSARKKIMHELNLDETTAIVLADHAWHPGIIGIIASKMVEEFNRPTVMIAVADDIGHGSARSIPSFHILEALESCRNTLLSVGGHAQAAGLKIHPDNIDEFRNMLNMATSQRLCKTDLVRILNIDAEITLSMVSKAVVAELGRLSPHGEGNPIPLFAVTNVKIVGQPRRIGSKGQHLSFYVKQGEVAVRAVAFGMGEQIDRLKQNGRTCSLAFAVKINTWMDGEQLELEVKDIRFDND
ncbi:MAG: single-stranded-DNA-specific exonuclease RecJ [Planctomycetia bacterium]|uniref:Single-stranded-DNA-specific exonuclease RecJ n=1 Tax=Candidatus Brocadia sapporoensis TaxID=392547 RepID=A0A1V6LWU9_9BACT|nr:single-stranded-DNA-specific exonuclease RecJ [Candidatus Brocadia sapporoensis]MCC7238782.1 single-stranded-DNA-specific exonuclease RecJ [Candidatus Brocadia sp.]QOJ07554.1 MAG: single-stranded-DNA-specific exonuclease RecJ [Planctomycetia bacterium]TVL98417.1 MAG: single-stranded-DNA-specific exonuclease RecJ [Candidatus Brocadia sp. BL1]MDG6004280.1 single-stranded-DNA-specific exonuclease RecJ [Candidatus Brocadia sp.]OQD44613.1 single-stranded-DNA-specific exonuclease RecJ [Candidatus